MERISLPDRYRKLIEPTKFNAQVNAAIDWCSGFCSDPTRGLVFFPEYTDHGPSHIQHVLDATEYLLTADSVKTLTPEDVAVLTIAVLLHDAGMHLSAEGFLALISTPAGQSPVTTFDKRTWPEEWDDYLSEASRWDGRKLYAVMGDASPSGGASHVDLASYVRSPVKMGSPDNWPVAYYKFIGEFIRRNHPRMAHEFVVRGCPGPSAADALPVVVDMDDGLRDLCGLVARSHGLRIRDTLSYLKTNFQSVVTCRNTHPVFLMVLLRIADYLQVESAV